MMTDFILSEEEAQIVVRSYNFLFELCLDHDFPVRPEELRIYDKINGHLEILANQRALGGPVPPNAAATSLVTERQLELARKIPDPPPSRFEEDEYDPT